MSSKPGTPAEDRVVVSDATPLRYLILIGEVDLIHTLYGQVSVPTAVLSELLHPKTPHLVRDWIRKPPSWISPEQVILESLPFADLGIGERQAIAMAHRQRNSILLTDDFQARVAAESLGIRVIPTVRILAAASTLGLVDFDEAILSLQQTNFRVSSKVILQIRQELISR